MKAPSELMAAIQKAVEEKTFSIEVLQHINDMRVAYQQANDQINSYKEEVQKYKKQYEQIYAENAALQLIQNNVASREFKVKEAETAQALQKLETDLTKQFKNDMYNLTLAIFKSPVVKEEIARSNNATIPSTISGSYPGQVVSTTSSEFVSITKKEE